MMKDPPLEETIAQRVERGRLQNSTASGAIVPFPPDTDFENPLVNLPSYNRSQIVGYMNNGYEMSVAVYRSESGEPIFVTLRMDHPDYCPESRPELKKQIRPLRCESVVGVLGKANLRHIEGARPLYNLDGLAARPTAPVLLVEGEKTADKAANLFPDHVAITWPGGAQSDRIADLRPLIARSVVLWPDNDADGIAAAERLAFQALRIGATECRIVQIPADFPEGWDLGDVDDGDQTTLELVRKLFGDARKVSAKDFATARAKKANKSTDGCGMSSESDLRQSESLLRFLINKMIIDLSKRSDWIRVGIALKATHGQPAFELWMQLSSEADGYDEDTIERDWNSFRDRPQGEKRLTMATFAKEARDAGWSSPRRRSGEDQQSNSEERAEGAEGGRRAGLPKNTDTAAFAVDLALDSNDEFWLDQNDKPHVSYTTEIAGGQEVTRHAPVDSSEYKNVLADRFYAAVGNKVLSSEQASLAAALLEHEARKSGLRHSSALRVGEHDGTLYLDLGRADGTVVEIGSGADAEAWRVAPSSPVRFVRGSRSELPLPEHGGTRAEFERHFNLAEDDLTRVIGFMIGTFNVSGSYPILMTDGEQGAGKSVLNDKIVALIDPPHQAKSARMSFNPKEEDLHLGSLGVHVPYFDNVSNFTADAADALCRLSTGGGSGRRKLYSNDQYHQIVVIRPIIVTCIGMPTSRPDLLSRSVRVTARSVAGRRRTERAILREFEADRPKMIGFLLNCVSAAIRNRDAVEAAVERGDFELPRMADFAEFVEGAAELLGLQMGQFSALIEGGQSAQQTEAVLGHPVGAGLMKYFLREDAPPLEATATQILTTLKSLLPAERHWPASNMLRKTLSRLAVGLRALGIEWEAQPAGGHENVAKLKIWATDRFTVPSNPTGGGVDENEPF